MTRITGDRLLSMGVLEAAHVIRTFKEKNLNVAEDEVVQTVRAIRADLYPLDYEAGIAIEAALPPAIDTTPSAFFRACIDAIIELEQPFWVRLSPGGREQVMRAVETNVMQCFRASGLLETPPDAETWQWWDRLAAKVRSDRDADLLAQGRQAELWSFEREQELVSASGIQRQPVWASIEDNSLGYDILSFRKEGQSEISRLIEVKSSQTNPPRLILTSNEWKTALQYGDALEFHLWTIDPRQLHVLTVQQMAPHIPLDHGAGRWLQVEVKLQGL